MVFIIPADGGFSASAGAGGLECQPEASLEDDTPVGHAKLDGLSEQRSIEQRHETRCQPFCLPDLNLCDLSLDTFLVLECQCESFVAKTDTVQRVFECELGCRPGHRFTFLVGRLSRFSYLRNIEQSPVVRLVQHLSVSTT